LARRKQKEGKEGKRGKKAIKKQAPQRGTTDEGHRFDSIRFDSIRFDQSDFGLSTQCCNTNASHHQPLAPPPGLPPEEQLNRSRGALLLLGDLLNVSWRQKTS
jgi:hypothetical protein